MLSKNELLVLIGKYARFVAQDTVNKYVSDKRIDTAWDLFNEIQALYEIQAKLIERLNAYHSDTMALMESPEVAYEWNHQLTLDMNNEVYELIGIEPPVESTNDDEE